ncbi:MAG: cytosolic protein [Calditrichaeota bacterium]|nr:MAG: cytosolic protein [Calditrichota bacterium]
MGTITLAEVEKYVEQNIGTFHSKRLASLSTLKLSEILRRKNPYLFKAKNILTAEELIRTFLDAHLSSQEETIFGEFLENLAIFVNGKVYGGIKSSAEGVDLEFNKEGIRYIVSIKSGPNWGNSSQIQRMRDNFTKAKRILRTNNPHLHVVAVNGCCYGRDNHPDKGDYFKYCGEQFWTFISGNEELYLKIIEPLGYRAKQRNEEFQLQYAAIVNRFSYRFMEHFCKNGIIDWEALVRFNSAQNAPDRHLVSSLNRIE